LFLPDCEYVDARDKPGHDEVNKKEIARAD
jgi:hypothetical protein